MTFNSGETNLNFTLRSQIGQILNVLVSEMKNSEMHLLYAAASINLLRLDDRSYIGLRGKDQQKEVCRTNKSHKPIIFE